MRAGAQLGPLFGLLAVGCWEVTRPSLPVQALPPAPPPPAAEAPPPIASAAAEIDETPDKEAFVAAPPLQVGPAVQISEVVGITPGAAGAMIAPALERLQKCRSGSRGKLVVQIIAERESAHLRVTDEGSMEAATNHCALEALSIIDVDQAMNPTPNPSDALQRIETQLVITW